jgi:CheY-like chemotaxis protein
MESKKILIVEDDIDVLNVYKSTLENEGYAVDTAASKDEALKKASGFKPDLFILDVMLTEHYEGFEIAQELNNNPEFKNVPKLIQTSIEVLTTTDGQKESVQDMAREFRKDPQFSSLNVLLINNLTNDLKGVDYMDDNGVSHYFQVEGFLKKPVTPKVLLPEVNRVLG